MKNTLSGRSVDKKAYGYNIASWPRWILTLIIGVLGGTFLGTIIFTIILQLPVFQKGGFLECEASLIQVAGSFGGIYFGLWLCLRLICKTSMRTFLFG